MEKFEKFGFVFANQGEFGVHEDFGIQEERFDEIQNIIESGATNENKSIDIAICLEKISPANIQELVCAAYVLGHVHQAQAQARRMFL